MPPPTDLRAVLEELTGAMRFVLAFYEPQNYLDTEAWKRAEAGARRAFAKAEAALSAPSSIATPPWQPIETAWADIIVGWASYFDRPRELYADRGLGVWRDVWGNVKEATHWMPLPDPPSSPLPSETTTDEND